MEAKGYGAAGGSLITELKKLVPTVTTYAVDYPVGAALSTLNRIDLMIKPRPTGRDARQRPKV